MDCQGMTPQRKAELWAERAELQARIEAATQWGAGLAERAARVRAIDAALAAEGEKPPCAYIECQALGKHSCGDCR